MKGAEKMKNILTICACVGLLCLFPYACKEGARRQAVVDCYKAQEICTKYWNAHGGDCLECKTMNECQQKGLFEE